MKNQYVKIAFLSVLIALFVECAAFAQADVDKGWYDQLKSELPYLGHRNWVLIVDAAYPLQSSSAIKTIISDEKIENVASKVLKLIDNSDHIKPIVYQDKEFSYMKNEWSKNCETLKTKMADILTPYSPNVILHDEIFPKLDAASQLFNVIVIKTNSIVPYSSIFM